MPDDSGAPDGAAWKREVIHLEAVLLLFLCSVFMILFFVVGTELIINNSI